MLRIPRLPLLLALIVSALPLRAAVEFVGVLATPERSLFALTDTESGRTTWVGLGKHFGDYTVTRYEAKTDTLTLTRNGTETQLHLKPDAKVQPARLELTGTASLGLAGKLEVLRATLQFDQENELPLMDGLVAKITPRRRPDGNILYALIFERSVDGKPTERIAAPAIVARPDGPFRIDVGDASFAFSPKNF